MIAREANPMARKIGVTTPDGLAIAAVEWCNSDGPEIFFLHGYMQ
jgi:hypothetical protein